MLLCYIILRCGEFYNVLVTSPPHAPALAHAGEEAAS